MGKSPVNERARFMPGIGWIRVAKGTGTPRQGTRVRQADHRTIPPPKAAGVGGRMIGNGVPAE